MLKELRSLQHDNAQVTQIVQIEVKENGELSDDALASLTARNVCSGSKRAVPRLPLADMTPSSQNKPHTAQTARPRLQISQIKPLEEQDYAAPAADAPLSERAGSRYRTLLHAFDLVPQEPTFESGTEQPPAAFATSKPAVPQWIGEQSAGTAPWLRSTAMNAIFQQEHRNVESKRHDIIDGEHDEAQAVQTPTPETCASTAPEEPPVCEDSSLDEDCFPGVRFPDSWIQARKEAAARSSQDSSRPRAKSAPVVGADLKEKAKSRLKAEGGKGRSLPGSPAWTDDMNPGQQPDGELSRQKFALFVKELRQLVRPQRLTGSTILQTKVAKMRAQPASNLVVCRTSDWKGKPQVARCNTRRAQNCPYKGTMKGTHRAQACT